MISRAFKLRFRRRLRLHKLQLEEFGQQAEKHVERHFFSRFDKLAEVRRFIVTWIILIVLLSGCVIAQTEALRQYYQTPSPVPGGTYAEGILGSFTTADPLYATNPVDSAVSKLIFASLFTYNDQDNLVGDLAQSWTVNSLGTVYTVRLKPDLTWQDGRPLTAADVVFTYQVIQNPDAQSPLFASWQGIKVAEANPLTVTFTLPDPLSSFIYSLTNGIVPEHILGGQPMTTLSTLPFNTTQPVGAGPFQFDTLQVSGDSVNNRQEQIALVPFTHYQGGEPKLTRFIIHSFLSQSALLQSYQARDINAIVGLTTVPSQLKNDASTMIYSLPLTAAVMTFFKTSSGVLSDVNVRQALVRATNTEAIIANLGYPTLPVREPLLLDQLGYNPAYAQASYNLEAANTLLAANGWTLGANGVRSKNGVPLAFTLYTTDTSEYTSVADMLQKQWSAIGADVTVIPEDITTFQTTLTDRNYDALLYGISIGIDPDVIVYWGSMYADPNAQNSLNFSEYDSPAADASLEAGRTRLDPALRVIKYEGFLQAWQVDAPAVGLYQPRFLYITRGPVYGLTEHPINSDVERFDNVQNWMIRVKGVSEAK